MEILKLHTRAIEEEQTIALGNNIKQKTIYK